MPHPFASRSTTVPSFAPAEWDLLVRLPGRLLVAAMSAEAAANPGAVYATDSMADGLAGLEAIAAGRARGSRLVQDVVAAIYSEPAADSPAAPINGATYSASAVAAVLADARSAVRMLGRRVGDSEAGAYRDWLVDIVAAAGPRPAARRFRVDLTLALTF